MGERNENDLNVRAVLCSTCGLMYPSSPRMTPEWSGRYYTHEYRLQMARFHGYHHNANVEHTQLFERQMRHGNALDSYIRSCHVGDHGRFWGRTTSAGGILKALRRPTRPTCSASSQHQARLSSPAGRASRPKSG